LSAGYGVTVWGLTAIAVGVLKGVVTPAPTFWMMSLVSVSTTQTLWQRSAVVVQPKPDPELTTYRRSPSGVTTTPHGL
jgi:hypothetical protein